MAQYNQDLLVNILGDASSLTKAVNQSKAQMNMLSKSMTRFGKRMSTRLTLPIVAAGGAAVKMAADMQESLNKVDVAFGSSSKGVKDFAKTTLTQFGIARGAALEMTSMFGDMATGMGINQVEAAKMSKELTGLAGDLASFKNINIDEAMTALSGVFTGETESLKRLGIVMTEANLESFRMAQGIEKSVKKMTQQEKVMLRLNYIFSVTKNAQGDFARTQDSASNQMRIFTQGVKELSTNFGELLLPILTKIVTKANDIVQGFMNMDQESQKMLVTVGALAAGIPVMITALGLLLNPLNAVAIAFAAVAVIIYTHWDGISKEIVKVTNSMIDLYNNSIEVQKVVALIRIGFAVAFTSIQYLLNNTITLLSTFIGVVFNAVKLLVRLGQLIVPDLSGRTFSEEFAAVGDAYKDLSNVMGEGLSTLFGYFDSSQFDSSVDQAKKALGDIGKPLEHITVASLNQGIATALNTLKTKATNILQGVASQMGIGGGGGSSQGDPQLMGGTMSDNPMGAIPNSVVPMMIKPVLDRQSMTEAQMIIEQANAAIGQSIQNFVANTGMAIGEAIGNMLSGAGDATKTLGQKLLGAFGGLLKMLGQIALTIGTSLLAIQASLKSINPFLAIAAGIALIALGTFFSNSVKDVGDTMGGGGVTEFAKGGIVSAPTLGLMGEYAGARSNPEVIAPLDRLQGMIGTQSQNVNVGGEFVIRGQDLVVSLEKANKTRNRKI